MEDAVKRFVWPALKTLIAVIVAVALVKIAFFPSQGDGTTADISPGYAADVKTVPVTKGSISNTVSVKGHIVQDATVEVQADLAGVVDSVAVEKDTQVSAGDPLLYIKHSESQPPVTKTDESGNVTQTPTEDKVTWSTIYAPVSGTVTPKVLKQQETGVGVVVATITPATYSATGTVSAAQQYRLTNAPTAATLTLEGARRPSSATTSRSVPRPPPPRPPVGTARRRLPPVTAPAWRCAARFPATRRSSPVCR